MNNKSPIRQTILLPNREAVNAAQVGLLLQTAQAITACLYAHQLHATEPHEDKPRLDGNVKAAAETTLIGVCDRLDKVLADDTRWTFDAQHALEKQLSAVYDANIALLRAQARLAEEAIRPHARYRPKLCRIDDTWIAVLGSVDDIDNSICGIGSTPQEALDAFDGVFTGQVPKHLVDWLAQVEAANLAGQQPPSFKQDNNEDLKQVDENRTIDPPGSKSSGEDSQSNSDGPGPEQNGNRSTSGPDGQNRNSAEI